MSLSFIGSSELLFHELSIHVLTRRVCPFGFFRGERLQQNRISVKKATGKGQYKQLKYLLTRSQKQNLKVWISFWKLGSEQIATRVAAQCRPSHLCEGSGWLPCDHLTRPLDVMHELL